MISKELAEAFSEGVTHFQSLREARLRLEVAWSAWPAVALY